MKPAPNLTGTPEHPLCTLLVIIFHTQWGHVGQVIINASGWWLAKLVKESR